MMTAYSSNGTCVDCATWPNGVGTCGSCPSFSSMDTENYEFVGRYLCKDLYFQLKLYKNYQSYMQVFVVPTVQM